ncbi:hypothetical protein J6590_011778 [Homalodisca vitripennis]|nr:hypothetical protein J6590_011778 [Homalodisca vitripennis]
MRRGGSALNVKTKTLCVTTLKPVSYFAYISDWINARLKVLLPIAQCNGYNGFRKIAGSSTVECGCCLDGWTAGDPVLVSNLPARPSVVDMLERTSQA